MRREVTVRDGKVVVRPVADDAISRVKKLRLRDKVSEGGLTDAERDIALLALLQKHDLL